MLKRIALVLGVVALLLASSGVALAQKTTVLRVVIVKTDNPAAYAAAIETGKDIMKKAGITATFHVYHATYAGPNTGTVVASIEFPSMAALAESETKLSTNKDYLEWIKGLEKIRTIVSDSIYREL